MINGGWTEYFKGLNEYENGVKALEKEESDALIKLSDAKLELEDTQEKLNSTSTPEWFYFTRKDDVAYDSYYQDMLRLQKIGYVFPLVFFLLAVLVSLTPISHMVEEHRTKIGVYKALGHKPAKIIIKYMVYAFSAGAIGGILGVIAGSNVFPRVTCLSSMSNAPAGLMRPKSPPDGKRVLIEKIPLIWNRLSFVGKVTARNIFRYRKRFIMTLVGLAGCSALLPTAFGLRDSVGGIAEKQYDNIVEYSSRAYIKEITSSEQRSDLDSLLSGKYLYICEESIDARNNDNGFSASLIVPESPEILNDFITLRSRKTGEAIPLTASGILVTEKLAREMGVSTGGRFNMTASDSRVYNVQIAGVVENSMCCIIYT